MDRALSGLAAALSLTLACGPAVAGETPLKCRIGKPSYCLKYGESRCIKTNDVPDRAKACARWTAGCLDCHGAIPACFGGRRPPAQSALCTTCDEAWRACMRRIDAQFWPGRLKS
jgi:hypothetical protein